MSTSGPIKDLRNFICAFRHRNMNSSSFVLRATKSLMRGFLRKMGRGTGVDRLSVKRPALAIQLLIADYHRCPEAFLQYGPPRYPGNSLRPQPIEFSTMIFEDYSDDDTQTHPAFVTARAALLAMKRELVAVKSCLKDEERDLHRRGDT